MSSLEISVTSKQTGRTTLREIFQIQDTLARKFVEQIESLTAGLPPSQVGISRTSGPHGETVLDIELGGHVRKPPVTSPTFEDLYRDWRPPRLIEIPYEDKS